MAELKLVVGHKGNTRQFTLTEEQVRPLRGLRIGQTFKGDAVGLPGYELEIRGGTDANGFPMRPDLSGTGRKRLLLTDRPGYKPKEKGIRRRKTVRGNAVDADIAQLNVKVVKAGKKKLEELTKKAEE